MTSPFSAWGSKAEDWDVEVQDPGFRVQGVGFGIKSSTVWAILILRVQRYRFWVKGARNEVFCQELGGSGRAQSIGFLSPGPPTS